MTAAAVKPETKGRKRELAVRIISGIVLIALALTDMWLGGWSFTVFVLVVGILMLREWWRLTACIGPAMQWAGLGYVALPVAGLLLLRDQPNGFALALWTMAIVWATDIGAFFVGRAVGRAKLAPSISPNKSWAGLWGGVACAILVGYMIANETGLTTNLAIVAGPLAMLAQAGDLFESWLKRRAGVKDSGRLIPGHGGVLDRVDGLVPVASLMGGLVLIGWL
jgi:phosphatidate cytidylyltransferase